MMAGLGSLTWPESDWTLGWVGLHPCYTLSNQCAQVKPAISTHTQVEISCMETVSCIIICKPYSTPAFDPTTLTILL